MELKELNLREKLNASKFEYYAVGSVLFLLCSTFFTMVYTQNYSQALGLIILNGMACLTAFYYGREHKNVQKV